MADRIERTERLLNLVLCLMDAATAVPRADIRERIPGYSSTASDAAFERMFERDKDELRSMGIPVETIVDVNGEVSGYRIPQERYALEGIDLTIPERAAVAVAAQAWGQAVVGPVAGTALRKLETVASDPLGWTPAGLQGNVLLTARDVALLPLMAAVRQNRVVTFDYQAPSDDGSQHRTVSPWGLRSAAGRWFLVGFDHDREDERTFRLSRMVGTVSVTGRERAQPPDDFDIGTYPIGAPADDLVIRARIRVRDHAAAALRRRSQEHTPDAWSAEVLTVEAPVTELVALVCAAGPDATVIDPPELVVSVIAALRALVDLHEAVASGGTP